MPLIVGGEEVLFSELIRVCAGWDIILRPLLCGVQLKTRGAGPRDLVWALVAWVRCDSCSEHRAASWLSCVFWVTETSVQQQVADHKQQKTTGDASFPATNMDICLWRTFVRLLPAAVSCLYHAAVVSKRLLAMYGRQQVVLSCVSCVVPGKYRFF